MRGGLKRNYKLDGEDEEGEEDEEEEEQVALNIQIPIQDDAQDS